MSHELRTPLNGVLGFAELLATSPLDDEQMNYVKIISESGNHLLDIVNDILDFSSIEKGTLRLKSGPVVVSSLLESSCLPVRKAAAEKGLDFRCEVAADVPEQIRGDAQRIRQILINLIGNAVKFTGQGSIVLRVARAPAGGREHLDFSVRDTGPGIQPEALGSLFEPFTQGDSTLHRPHEGTGLGLAISQRLAEAMEGTISVDSSPEKGSAFTLRIPTEGTEDPSIEAHDFAAESVLPRACGPPDPDGGPVLVVEDDRENSFLAGKILEALGHRAEFASNGREAVQAFAPGKFSAILMDMHMPVMDGLTATRRIRELEAGAGSHVPIIALTANVMPGDSERCFAAGMDAYLGKPFKKADLADKLPGAHLIVRQGGEPAGK